MAKPFPVSPKHPERICWGCDRYCAANALACGNGADRTMHPVEVFGEDWNVPGTMVWGCLTARIPLRNKGPHNSSPAIDPCSQNRC